MKKKIGPLELWQWLLIGGGTVLAYYLYESKKKSSSEVNPEEEEKLLGALDKATGGGGGSGGSEGNTTSTAATPVPSTPGPEGVAGVAGPAGPAGPQGEAPSAGLEAQVNALEQDVIKNQPPATSNTSAPQKLPKGEFKNAQNGLIERKFIKGKGIFHEYVTGGKGIKKGTVYKVGTVHKPKAPAKRVTKPKPVAKKVAAKKVAAKTPAHHVKKKEPVHR